MARVTLHCNHYRSSYSCKEFNLSVCYSHHFFFVIVDTENPTAPIACKPLLPSAVIFSQGEDLSDTTSPQKVCQGLVQCIQTALVSALCFPGVCSRQWKPVISWWRILFFELCLLTQSLPVAATSPLQTFSWFVLTILNVINLTSVPKYWS